MKHLEKFLKAYDINLKYFDLDSFLDDIMSIPYQIEQLEANIGAMNDEQKARFFALNKRLKELLEKTEAKDELQHKVLQEIRNKVEIEESLRHIAAYPFSPSSISCLIFSKSSISPVGIE